MIPLLYGVIALAVLIAIYVVARLVISGQYEGELKQNTNRIAQLEHQTKTLEGVWSIEQLIVNTLNVAEVREKIVNAVVLELEKYGFVASYLLQIDTTQNVLTPTATAYTPSIHNPGLRTFFAHATTISLSQKDHPFITSLGTKQMVISEHMEQLFGKLDTATTAALTQTGIKSAIAFPLISQTTPLGVLLFLLTKQATDVSAYELTTIKGFANAVAIALSNAMLYAKVTKTTQDLQIANEHLKELDKLKDEFVSLASHELRTPMTAIRGSLSTILDGYAGDVSPQTREFLTAAYNENDRLIRLVNNLLNISRIEAGRFKFEHKTFDYPKMVQEVVGNLQMAGKEKNLSVTYKPGIPALQLVSDEDKIREVLINLIGNAIKFTHQGGITVADRIEGNLVYLSVTDTGSGITKEDQDLLFKKISQVGRDTYAKQTGGTGLGLYISKQIIEGLGGTIWLESPARNASSIADAGGELGKGSAFHFTLPIAK